MRSLSRESSVEIEYNGPITSKKKVRVMSAAEVKAKKSSLKQSTYTISKGTRSAPPARSPEVPDDDIEKPDITKRPAWGYQNLKKKKKVAQSERDPFYSEQKARKEAMKVRRQQTLEAIANQNAPTVARKTTAAQRARARSRDKHKVENDFDEPSSVHVKSQNRVTGEERRPLHARSRSPAVLPLQNYLTERELRSEQQQQQQRQSRARSRSPAAPASYQYSDRRSASPPVPALKHHQRDHHGDQYDNYRRHDASAMSQRDTGRVVNAGKYADAPPALPPTDDVQFVPFIRSTKVLDPAHAEDPLPVSREATHLQRARQAYIQEHEPAKYGTLMENFEDSRVYDNVPRQTAPKYNKVMQ